MTAQARGEPYPLLRWLEGQMMLLSIRSLPRRSSMPEVTPSRYRSIARFYVDSSLTESARHLVGPGAFSSELPGNELSNGNGLKG
jgi:hypothetical protein